MAGPGPAHPLERRATLLATKLTNIQQAITMAVAPPGTRLPFTQQFTKPEALAWWRKNRYTPDGQKAMANMRPIDIMELDTELARHIEGNPQMTQEQIDGHVSGDVPWSPPPSGDGGADHLPSM